MNTPDSQQIVQRFFQCVRMLKESGKLRFITDFTDAHGIRHSTFQQAELNPASNRFQVAWIQYLSEDYGVSTDYIILGVGAQMKRKPQKV